MPELEAKMRMAPSNTSKTTSGTSHHFFSCRANRRNSLSTRHMTELTVKILQPRGKAKGGHVPAAVPLTLRTHVASRGLASGRGAAALGARPLPLRAIVLQPLAHADNIVERISHLPIELHGTLVRGPDLQIDLRTAFSTQQALGFLD